jgi:hypothetical protein
MSSGNFLFFRSCLIESRLYQSLNQSLAAIPYTRKFMRHALRGISLKRAQ